ncbi:MAG: hypothetical protein ABII79_11935 [bacterium]
MKTRFIIRLALPTLLVALLFAAGFGADTGKPQSPAATRATVDQKEKPAAQTAPVVTQRPPQSSAVTAPDSNQVIEGQIFTAGVTSASSASYSLAAGAGQMAVGEGSSASYSSSGGIWDFPIFCCQNRGDVDDSGGLDVGDLTYLVAYLFQGGPAPPCPEEGDVDASGGIDVGDLTYLVAYLFQGGPPPPPC